MAGCLSRCTTYRTDNINNAWLDVRDHFGPKTDVGSTTYTKDMSAWNVYASEKGIDPVTEVVLFGKWLIWKCSYGTNNYGNLPTRVRNHEGISGVSCPYSTDSDAARSVLWLGFSPSLQNDHGSYYMRVAQRGSSWGFECTFPGCPYHTDNGIPYFHI